MPEFNVFTEIRNLLATTDLTDPAEVGGKLLADLDTEHRALSFEQSVELVCSVVMTRDRNRRLPEPTAPMPGTRRNTKSAQIAQWYQGELRKRYLGADEWRMLGDFTQADHEFAAQARRSRAASIIANADWHEACAAAMAEADVDRFQDLPPSVLADLISRRRPE